MFSYSAGAHKSIWGWYTLSYSDSDQVNQVFNFTKKLRNQFQENTIDENNTEDEDKERGVLREDNCGASYPTNAEKEENNKKDTETMFNVSTILFVLLGPFTHT